MGGGEPIWMPFLMCVKCDDPAVTPADHPYTRVADLFAFIPRSRLAQVLDVLRHHAGCPVWMGLHNLAHWLGSSGGGVRFMLSSRHDANTENQWNPLFRIAGRREAAESTRDMCYPCWTKARAAEEDAICAGRPPVCFNVEGTFPCTASPPRRHIHANTTG